MDEHLPETVDQAIHYLLSKLDEENQNELKNMKREDLVKLHHGYGTGIRNSLGLWDRNAKLYSDPEITGKFPDDVSSYIIERMWDFLNS